MKKTLSEEAEKLLEQIESGDFAHYYYKTGWNELVENNMVNVWTDDAGYTFIEVGPQQ